MGKDPRGVSSILKPRKLRVRRDTADRVRRTHGGSPPEPYQGFFYNLCFLCMCPAGPEGMMEAPAAPAPAMEAPASGRGSCEWGFLPCVLSFMGDPQGKCSNKLEIHVPVRGEGLYFPHVISICNWSCFSLAFTINFQSNPWISNIRGGHYAVKAYVCVLPSIPSPQTSLSIVQISPSTF